MTYDLWLSNLFGIQSENKNALGALNNMLLMPAKGNKKGKNSTNPCK